MPLRYAYLLSIGNKNHDEPRLSARTVTLIFNDQGQSIKNRAEAVILATALASDGTILALDDLFLLANPDGSVFCFPDRTHQMINPYSHPLEIAYGFILPQREARNRIHAELTGFSR